MNNQEMYNEDLLKQYLNSERIEKAPEGFTSNVMTRVRQETLPLTVAGRSWKKNLVPVISVAVTILLIASAFLITGSQPESSTDPFLGLIKNIKISMPEINLSSIFKLSLPSVMIYALIGILVLILFDRALYGIFKREGK